METIAVQKWINMKELGRHVKGKRIAAMFERTFSNASSMKEIAMWTMIVKVNINN